MPVAAADMHDLPAAARAAIPWRRPQQEMPLTKKRDKKAYPIGLNPTASVFDPRKGWQQREERKAEPAPADEADAAHPAKAEAKARRSSHTTLAMLMPALLVPAPRGAADFDFDEAARMHETTAEYHIGELVIAHGLTVHTGVNSKKGRVRKQDGAFVKVDFGDDKRTLLAKNLRRPAAGEAEVEELEVAGVGGGADDDDVEVSGPYTFPAQPAQPVGPPTPALPAALSAGDIFSDEGGEDDVGELDAAALEHVMRQKLAIEERIKLLRMQEVQFLTGDGVAAPEMAPSPPPGSPPPESEDDVIMLASDDDDDEAGGRAGDDAPPQLIDDDAPPLLDGDDDEEGSEVGSDVVATSRWTPVSTSSPRGRGDADGSSQGMSEELSPRSDLMQPATSCPPLSLSPTACSKRVIEAAGFRSYCSR